MSTLTTNYLTPTGREEAWRFTPLKRLGGLHDGTYKLADRHSLALDSELVEGVSFERISRELVSTESTTDDVIVARIHEAAKDVSLLKIAPNTELIEPISLCRKASGTDAAELSRVQVRIGANAKATLIFENFGDHLIAEDIEIICEPGSNLTVVSLQEWGSKTIHAGRQHAIVEKDATFKSVMITVGGDVVRILPTVEFRGQGASAELLGVYLATSGQFFEHRMFVDHLVPSAKSRVNYKGALAGQDAHTVWIGDVFIRAAAEGTDTYELNRNLLLSDGARADSVPNLEIETGEIVGAGHASTTGRFDDEQLFYLMSRGISLESARRLVVRGFFNEIVSEISDVEIQERLMARIDNELEKAGA